MPTNSKKISESSLPRYTTRQIMELTEQRRLKRDAMGREKVVPAVPAIEIPQVEIPASEGSVMETAQQRRLKVGEALVEADAAQEVQIIEQVQASMIEKKEEIIPDKGLIPLENILGPLVFSLAAFAVIAFAQFSESTAASWINRIIVQSSLWVLNMLQSGCVVQGEILKTSYYTLSLHEDLVGLYSLELTLVFAAVLSYFQQPTSLLKRALRLISLLPLAVVVNLFRVIAAFGLAMNHSANLANISFNGILEDLVFIGVVLGFICIDFLLAPEI